jgi:hypothetical protein
MRNRRRPPRKPKPREARKTVLLIGEGDTEVFFLKHIMKLYNSRGCGVACTVRCAHGKGPEHILALPSRCEKTADYDHKAVLLDSDIPLPEKNEAEARSQGSSCCYPRHVSKGYCLAYCVYRYRTIAGSASGRSSS